MADMKNSLNKLSIKHLQIDKAHWQMILMVSAATIVVVFSLFALQTLVKQINYQNKVIGLRSKANNTLKSNVSSAQALQTAYKAFDESPESVLGTSDRNGKIVLDALPSKYDFPAVVSSLSYLSTISGVALTNVTGTDEELSAQQESSSPQVVEIPLDITVIGTYDSTKKFVENLEKSIRPFQITTASMRGNSSAMTLQITGKTYYQPEKRLQLNETVVPSSGKLPSSSTGAKQ